jgi:hypothetical protein
MSSTTTTKLNLRPQERRLIALVAIVLFVVLNIVFVWPHFGDWGTFKLRQERAERTLQTYDKEIQKTKAYQVKLRELESAGSSVVPEEQELDLVRVVDNQARLNGLFLIQLDTRPRQSTTETNRFFEEQYVTLHGTSDNEQLVNFLVSLTTNSLIRVKDLSLKPADVGVTKLDEQMTLVASYQRKTPASLQPQPAPTAAPVTAAKTPLPRALAKTNKPSVTPAKPSVTPAKPALTAAKPGVSPSPALTNKLLLPRTRSTNQAAKKP